MFKKPSYLRQFWAEARWIILGMAWLAGLLLGYAGFARFSLENGLEWSAGDIFYRTLQLIILESGSVDGPINGMLETARFLLPTLAAYTTLQALALLFREKMQWLRLWRLHDHTIICGLGRKGGHLADELLRLGQPVVVVENQPERTRAADLCRRGAILVRGDATHRETLVRARLFQARYLVCLMGDDSQNLQAAFQAYQLASDRRRGILTCIVHLNSIDLLNLIKRSELIIEKGIPFQIETFHPYQSAARWLIQQDPAWQEKVAQAAIPDHLLIVGLGRLGEQVVVQAAYAWHRRRPRGPLTLTILDRQAEQRTAELLRKYPLLDQTCHLVPCNAELHSTALLYESLTRMPDDKPFRRVYICLGDPVLSLQVCWSLLEKPVFQDVPIRVRLDRQSGLFGLVKKPLTAAPYPGQVIPFDPIEPTCSAELVMGGLHEMLARELHQRYLDEIGAASAGPSWDRLAEDEKEANRLQANRIHTVLTAAGYRIAPLQDWDAEDRAFPSEDVERMAKLEHELWCQTQRANGWRWGPQKDKTKRTHPDLLPTDI